MIVSSNKGAMKVLHILDRSMPDLSGYSIRSKYIVESQKKIGIRPAVVTSPRLYSEAACEKINGITYHRSCFVPGPVDSVMLKLPFLREQVEMRKLHQKITQALEQERFDVIHAHSPSLCGLPAMKAARRKGIPFVYEVRAFWEDAAVDRKRFTEGSLKYRLSQKMEQRVFDNADAIVCICEGLSKEIDLRTRRDVIHIVPNGVDTSIFLPQPKAERLIEKYGLKGKTVVGFIGSFFTFEGLADLVKCVPKVLAAHKDVAFVLVGSGVEEENLKQLAMDSGFLNKTVIFTGRVPHDHIQDYYSIMDILVYPRISKRITELVTPLKPLEAMAMEKAVVASDVGGLKELVKDGETGVLFEAGNVDALAESILLLVMNEEMRMEIGISARADMSENREWAVIMSRYLDIYSSILQKRAIRIE
jgi:PEP-CTERM/exosortase A-associated glycosyltransferase